MARGDLKKRVVVLILAVALSGVFFIDLCALVFDCGCRSLWNGAAEACNIHRPQGPHCPWCARPFTGGAVAFFAGAAAQSLILLRPGRGGLALRFLLALAAFPVASGLVGALQAILWDY